MQGGVGPSADDDVAPGFGGGGGNASTVPGPSSGGDGLMANARVRQNASSTLSATSVDDHGPRGGQQADDWAYRQGGGGTYDGDGRKSLRISASIVRGRGSAVSQVEGRDFQNG
jgi:hypothetical protein